MGRYIGIERYEMPPDDPLSELAAAGGVPIFVEIQERKGTRFIKVFPGPITGWPEDIRASRRIIKDMSALDESLLRARTELLAVKLRLNMVDVPQSPLHLPGSVDGTVFSSANVKAAWARRMALLNRPQTRN